MLALIGFVMSLVLGAFYIHLAWQIRYSPDETQEHLQGTFAVYLYGFLGVGCLYGAYEFARIIMEKL